jgi:leucyl aminopeptidase
MPLTIRTAQKPSKKISFTFFLLDNAHLEKELLFKFFEPDEALYMQGIRSELKPKEKEVKVLLMPGTKRKVIVVGLGKRSEMTVWKAALATRIAVQAARKEKVISFAFGAQTSGTMDQDRRVYEVIASNAAMANFEFVKYKTPPPGGFSFIKGIEAVWEKPNKNIAEGLRRGLIIGEETNACRELSNMPGGDMTPGILAAHAVRVAKKAGIRATVLDEKKIRALKMGGVLGVAQGSDAPPKFIILEYMKGPKQSKPVVLAGKGVTFDTGGLNLKPSNSIYEMHMDMSGGAAVIHTIVAAARLKLKKNIVALIPAVENMPSGSSYRPGDVLRTMSGKTIEVLNTDAEGRVILADALEYAKRYKPALVVDVATLTGAAIVALGLRYSGLFATDKKLEDTFRRIGQDVGDPVWPLPFSADYEDDIRGTFGDWANSEKTGRAGGGASTAATFLWQFTKTGSEQAYPWVHLDIAPRMTSIPSDMLAQGAAGTPVRLLVRLLDDMT